MSRDEKRKRRERSDKRREAVVVPETGYYLFTKAGIVQHYEQDGNRGMVVASNEAAALAFAKNYTHGRMSPAKIGSVEGETFAGQLAASMAAHGANGFYLTHDGETLQFAGAGI